MSDPNFNDPMLLNRFMDFLLGHSNDPSVAPDENTLIPQHDGPKQRSHETMEAIRQLPPFQGLDVADNHPFLGICFDKKKNNQKCKIEYHSAAERAWCECSELVDQKLWDQADKLFLDEVQFYLLRFDFKLYANIRIGLALDSKKDEDFQEAIEFLVRAIQQDDGSDSKQLFGKYADLLSIRLFYRGVPKYHYRDYNLTGFDDELDNGQADKGENSDEEEEEKGEEGLKELEWVSLDYGKVQNVQLLQDTIQAWSEYCKVLMDYGYCGLTGLGDDRLGDCHLDALNCAFGALVDLDPSNKESLELVQATALQMIRYRVSSASTFRFVFLTYHATVSEALGEISAANESYRSLKEEPEMNEDYIYDEEEDPLQFFSTDIVPNGSIDERIQRTGGN